jgi:hypothetical protein
MPQMAESADFAAILQGQRAISLANGGTGDIQKVDAIYLWFVRVEEASIAQRG